MTRMLTDDRNTYRLFVYLHFNILFSTALFPNFEKLEPYHVHAIAGSFSVSFAARFRNPYSGEKLI